MGRVQRNAFTLVELLIVLAIVGLLVAMLLPSLSSAREQARRVQCAARLHSIHTALWTYSAAARRRLPPFAFQTFEGLLPASGHWGGTSDGTGVGFGRRGVEHVNLSVLVLEGHLTGSDVVCPSAEGSSGAGPLSSYCLRFPPSEDLFSASSGLAYRGGELLGIYRQAAGGVSVRVGRGYQEVPQVRLGGLYAPVAEADAGGGAWDPMVDALLVDGFWGEHAVRHAGVRNVCFGDGSVRSLESRGRLVPGGDDGVHAGRTAEAFWRVMDERR